LKSEVENLIKKATLGVAIFELGLFFTT
jgi:hypothetical protein